MKVIMLLRLGMVILAVLAALWTASDLRRFVQIDPNDSPAEISASLNRVLASAMQRYSIAGVAAGAIKRGKVIWSARMGRATADGKPVTGETAFNIGSVSKPLTVWAVLALAQQGAIELDAPVSRYLKRFALPPGKFSLDDVTVRRLLRHTAGTNIHGYGGYSVHEDQPVDVVQLSEKFEPLAVVRKPGSKRVYSGGGYELLQMMIEDVTGLGFDAALQKLVLKPLAMKDSGFIPAALPTRSEAFAYHGNQIEDLRNVALAAAGAYVSGDDMARFLLAHIDGGGVLTPASLAAAFAPTEPNPAFGMSYTRWETPSGLLIGHGGNNSSWNTQIYVRPGTGDGFYFLANSTSGAQLDFDLSCAWLSMIKVDEGAARCAEAINVTHKISWSAYGIAMLGMLVAYWLAAGIFRGTRSLSPRPIDRGRTRLFIRMFAFLVVLVMLGTAICVFYTDTMMWRSGVTLIDEMPVDEIGNLTAAITTSLGLLALALWSSPVPVEPDA